MDYIGIGVVLRVGELFLKGNNRHVFERLLERNVRRAVKDRDDLKVVTGHGRVFVLGAADEDVMSRLRWVFGAVSMSKAYFCERTIDAITETALNLACEFPKNKDSVFRISARRSDKNFEYTSTELGRLIGAEVVRETGMGVNLEQYDLNISIEVGKRWTFLFCDQRPAGGGLPVGSSGKIELLLSGGIDSPVAGHMMQKRGLELSCVYFHAFPYTGDGAKNKVIELAQVLARRQKNLNLHVVQFAKIQESIRDRVDGSYLVIMYRRAMIKIAIQLAAKQNIRGLATGESLGQVASQTLANLAAVQDSLTIPILRPLIAFDKIETINVAREIGTYDISILPHDDCCTLFVPKHPETKGSIGRARKFESMLDLDSLLDEAVQTAELIKL